MQITKLSGVFTTRRSVHSQGYCAQGASCLQNCVLYAEKRNLLVSVDRDAWTPPSVHTICGADEPQGGRHSLEQSKTRQGLYPSRWQLPTAARTWWDALHHAQRSGLQHTCKEVWERSQVVENSQTTMGIREWWFLPVKQVGWLGRSAHPS